MIHIAPATYLLAALLLVMLPLDWLIYMLLAALFHEMCHLFSVYLFNGRLLRIKVRFLGCTIEATGLGELTRFLSILAGPLGSFSLLLLYRSVPKLAICGFLQGAYNLLPLEHMDGGNLLRIILNHLYPQYADRILYIIATTLCVLFVLSATILVISYKTGAWPIFAAIIWSIRMLSRKIPCKPWQIGVQ